MNAGATIIRTFPIISQYVVMAYDFYLSSPNTAALELRVEFFSTLGNWVTFARKVANQFVDIRLSKGFAMFKQWRIRVINYGLLAADCYFSAHGITTTENSYYGGILAGINP